MLTRFFVCPQRSDFIRSVEGFLFSLGTRNEIQAHLARKDVNIKYYDIVSISSDGPNEHIKIVLHGGLVLPEKGFYTVVR